MAVAYGLSGFGRCPERQMGVLVLVLNWAVLYVSR